MACIKWSQPILTSFGWYAIPTGYLSQWSLSENPRIDPFFSPPLNHTFWKPWPAAHLSCIGWVQVSGALAFCACSTPFEFISFWPSHYFCCLCVFCCTCLLVFIFYGVKDVWAIVFIFSFFYPFLDWVLLGQKPSFSYRAHHFHFYDRGPFGHWSYHITSCCLL